MIIQTEAHLRTLQGTWRLDPQRTSIAFRARLLALIRATGTLRHPRAACTSRTTDRSVARS